MTTAPAPPAGSPLPTGEAKRQAVRQMFDSIAGRYQLVNTIMSFGLDRAWRRRCAESLQLPPGSRVLDVACGTGDLCAELARLGQQPVGLDLSPGMLAHARTAAGTTVTAATGDVPLLVLGDALGAPFAGACFDGAVSGFALRNVVDLAALFTELGRLVRPGGRICLLDLGQPDNSVLRWGHRLWSGYGVPVVGSVLSDAAAYRYLPRSLAYLPPAEVTVRLLEESGFGAVQRQPLSAGVAQLFVATRRRPAAGVPA